MKKLLVLALTLCFVTGLFAASASAEDRLSLAGQVRVRGFDLENFRDYDDDNEADDNAFWDQRFRMQATIAPADGVKGVVRVDFAEGPWGTGFTSELNGPRPTQVGVSAGELDVDRAYIDVTKGMFNVKAGLQLFGLGNFFAYDNNGTGLQVTVKTPLVITLGTVKESEGAGTGTAALTDDELSEDTDHYFGNLGYKGSNWSVNAFLAAQVDETPAEDEPMLYGASGTFGIGPVKIYSELDIFDGENQAGGFDYMGIQFIADGSMALSDALTLGVQFVYSDGSDDPTERKITRMPNAFFGSMYYGDYGAFATDLGPWGAGDVFDPRDTQAGSVGGGVYAKWMPMSALTLYGQFFMAYGQEDINANMFDNGYVVNLSGEYMLVKNATVAAGYSLSSVEPTGDVDLDIAQGFYWRLQITF